MPATSRATAGRRGPASASPAWRAAPWSRSTCWPNADIAEEPMCRGDDPSCSECELHHRQFVEDMARERRAFLASRFAAKGGAATLAAGGLALPKKISTATRHAHLPATADTVQDRKMTR